MLCVILISQWTKVFNYQTSLAKRPFWIFPPLIRDIMIHKELKQLHEEPVSVSLTSIIPTLSFLNSSRAKTLFLDKRKLSLYFSLIAKCVICDSRPLKQEWNDWTSQSSPCVLWEILSLVYRRCRTCCIDSQRVPERLEWLVGGPVISVFADWLLCSSFKLMNSGLHVTTRLF